MKIKNINHQFDDTNWGEITLVSIDPSDILNGVLTLPGHVTAISGGAFDKVSDIVTTLILPKDAKFNLGLEVFKNKLPMLNRIVHDKKVIKKLGYGKIENGFIKKCITNPNGVSIGYAQEVRGFYRNDYTKAHELDFWPGRYFISYGNICIVAKERYGVSATKIKRGLLQELNKANPSNYIASQKILSHK